MPRLSRRSLDCLLGVHPDLVAVVHRAIVITQQDFSVICGLRSAESQRALVRGGRSWSLRSRHLTGHAVDVAPFPVDFSDLAKFLAIRDAFFSASEALDIPIRWGGDWNGSGDFHDEIRRGVFDGGHFELPRSFYP